MHVYNDFAKEAIDYKWYYDIERTIKCIKYAKNDKINIYCEKTNPFPSVRRFVDLDLDVLNNTIKINHNYMNKNDLKDVISKLNINSYEILDISRIG